MQFKQYPSYKNSGVEWLGHVPEHWNTKPTKYCFKLITDKAIENNSEVLLSVYTDIGVKPRSELEERGNKASTTDGYWIVKKGDIIVNKLLAWMGAIGLSNYSGVTSPAYDILRIKYNYTPEYYNYLFRNGDMFTEFKRYSRGLMDMRLRLYFSEFGNIKLPVPSIDEQQKIVSFLDIETARIDNLISKQEKLIELLEEQRKSIISHAVTKGLNPDAPMKDSGVEWLGDVPEHWEVFQLKSAIKGWRNGKWGNEPAAENNICCVRVADFDRTKGVINTTKLTYRNYHGENISECILDENSILIERSGGGEKQLVGATVVNTLKQTAVCSNFISLLNINPNRVNIFFLQKCFENLYTRKVNEKSIKQTSGIQNLDLKQYLQNNIAYPSLDEQKSIVSYLDAECKKIDLLVDKQYQLIRKLKNYRTSIISHAVTGKIDVREFGA